MGTPHDAIFVFQRVENEKIIFQNVEFSEVCDQNGDRLSNNDKICHICSIRQKRTFS